MSKKQSTIMEDLVGFGRGVYVDIMISRIWIVPAGERWRGQSSRCEIEARLCESDYSSLFGGCPWDLIMGAGATTAFLKVSDQTRVPGICAKLRMEDFYGRP